MTVMRQSGTGGAGVVAPLRSGWVRWLRVPVYLGCLLAFLTDISHEVSLFFGLFYLPLICTAVLHRSRRSVWYLSALAIFCVVVGFFFPIINPNTVVGLINRLLSIVAICTTAILVDYSRRVQERLVEQTERAEAAEQFKTRVFTTLTEEFRKPLHVMVGLISVMMATCRPDQREPLGQVQSSSKHLLATIENLTDLTGINNRLIHIEPVDLDTLLHEACDAMKALAAERNIAITFDTSRGERSVATGDAWAIRRIVDNLIANALEFSPPGSMIELSTETDRKSVEIIVRDTGVGMSEAVLRRLTKPHPDDDDGFVEDVGSTGSGLTLSRRLADAMHAELLFDSQLGTGTTVKLRLPA